MKKLFYLILVAGLFCSFSAKSQTVDTDATVTWSFGEGTEGQTATYSSGTSDYFSLDYVSLGSNLAYIGKSTTYNVTYTLFQPEEQLGSAGENCLIAFNVRPKTGLKFTPTSISFDCMRFGTDGGYFDISWQSNESTETSVATEIKPARNNSGAGTHVEYDLTSMSISESDGECSLNLYLYDLGNTKKVGIANVIIKGHLAGTVADIETYTLTTSASPEDAGSISNNPAGTEFDEGTEVTLTASRNFGYNFSHWENESGETVSTENPYTVTMNANTTLKAVFTTINTYSLTVNTEGGGKDYMVTASPEATTIDDVLMYEEGTTVTLTASNNPIITFTNWGTGETTQELSFKMTENKTITAVFSSIDYIVGWDFYKSGSNGRVADFSSTSENESATMVLRNAEGTTTGWLDKSEEKAGGYEGEAAAVNWQALADKYYYQIKFNAKNFTDIKFSASMLLNYNGYSVQKCEYSLDGETFDSLGIYTIENTKVWYEENFDLPDTANNAETVYIRWIPDYSSSLTGSETTKDGTAISSIYVTATETIYDDGTAPVLSSTVPANDATGASATGKIVLTFDEKIQITEGTTATLGNQTLNPEVSGKTITFNYSGLDYNTKYTFNLAGNTVSDLAGNTLTSEIEISFTTMDRPTVTKKAFDFVVGIDGDFKAAIAAANNASSSGERFYIFFPDGEYNIGENTGDDNQMTTVAIPNVSYIGESADSVIIYNKSINESIGSTATLYLTRKSDNIYMQDITLRNKMDYRTGTLIGRGVVLWDKGDKNIYKNVNLESNQDTYYTGGDIRSYLENCTIHGTVDFICGGGDIFFNECLLYLEKRSNNCITAPATDGDWGYVFNSCTIDGYDINNNSYRLGRPWSNAPKSVYINTTMIQLPTATAWGDPMNVVPAVFAEYNSMTENGATVDLSNRRTSYTKDNVTVTLNPVLTEAQASEYTLENVLGGDDTWQPNLYTEQSEAPVISGNDKTITWDNSDYVLCWGIFKNGSFVEFVTTNSYTIPNDTPNGTYTVRAANEMGGLGESSNEYYYDGYTGIEDLELSSTVVEKRYYTIDGRKLISNKSTRGVVIVKTIYSDGHSTTKKIVNLKNY